MDYLSPTTTAIRVNHETGLMLYEIKTFSETKYQIFGTPSDEPPEFKDYDEAIKAYEQLDRGN